jgi:hypothetical protein
MRERGAYKNMLFVTDEEQESSFLVENLEVLDRKNDHTYRLFNTDKFHYRNQIQSWQIVSRSRLSL